MHILLDDDTNERNCPHPLFFAYEELSEDVSSHRSSMAIAELEHWWLTIAQFVEQTELHTMHPPHVTHCSKLSAFDDPSCSLVVVRDQREEVIQRNPLRPDHLVDGDKFGFGCRARRASLLRAASTQRENVFGPTKATKPPPVDLLPTLSA